MKKPAETEGEVVLCFFISQKSRMSDAQNENDSLRMRKEGCEGMRRGGKRGKRNEKKRSRDGEAQRNEE